VELEDRGGDAREGDDGVATPMTMAIWFGLRRVGPGSGSVVSSA
jgi:hypothetical protein